MLYYYIPYFYILDDILSEIYGYKKTRRVIFLGFFMNLIAIVCFTITINMPSPQFFEHHKAYAIFLESSTDSFPLISFPI